MCLFTITRSTQSLTIVLFVCFVLVLDRNLAKITGVGVWMPWEMLCRWKKLFISHCWTYTVKRQALRTLRYTAIIVCFLLFSIHPSCLTRYLIYLPCFFQASLVSAFPPPSLPPLLTNSPSYLPSFLPSIFHCHFLISNSLFLCSFTVTRLPRIQLPWRTSGQH